MKKIFLVLFILTVAVSLCYAERAPKSTIGMNMSTAPTYKNIIAEVKSVTVADVVKGIKSEIVVVDKSEAEPKEYTVPFTPDVIVQNAIGEEVGINALEPGQKVKVKLRVIRKGEEYEAVSIKVMQKQ